MGMTGFQYNFINETGNSLNWLLVFRSFSIDMLIRRVETLRRNSSIQEKTDSLSTCIFVCGVDSVSFSLGRENICSGLKLSYVIYLETHTLGFVLPNGRLAGGVTRCWGLCCNQYQPFDRSIV